MPVIIPSGCDVGIVVVDVVAFAASAHRSVITTTAYVWQLL